MLIIITTTGKIVNLLTDDDYINSVIYIACNIVFVALASLVGFLLVRYRYTPIFWQLVPVAKTLRRNYIYIGYMVTIAAHNGLLALTFLMYHQRIWWYTT